MTPLSTHCCDSCGEEAGFLFPIAVIDELPSGGEAMVIRYYCYKCMKIVTENLEENEEEEEEEEEEESPTPDRIPEWWQ